jgi:hypothetical protein
LGISTSAASIRAKLPCGLNLPVMLIAMLSLLYVTATVILPGMMLVDSHTL